MKIDDLDRRIIDVMRCDARLSNGEIASRVGSNGPTVRRRIEKLIENKVMQVVAVADPRKLGYNVLAVIALQVEHTALQDIEKALLALPEVHFAGFMMGAFNVLIEVWLHSNEELLTFMHDKLGQIQGIQRVEAQQAIKMIKYTYDWGA